MRPGSSEVLLTDAQSLSHQVLSRRTPLCWLKPNVDVNDIESIWEYALTVNGYEYAKPNLGVECADLANQKLNAFESSGIWTGSFEELRCCLFYEQRRWHHFGTDPSGDQLLALQALVLAISELSLIHI